MTLLLGVLAASLVGSIHCAAMCGSFVCLFAGGAARRGATATAQLAYNGGRLVSYVTLGLVAGSLGARIDDVGVLVNVQRAAAIVAGVLMLVWASVTVATAFGARVGPFGFPQWAKQQIGRVLLAINDQPVTTRAAATGLLTTLLPCGWLYTFVVTAGGTGNPIAGAAVMFAFWLGTLPLMIGVGLGVGRVARPIARHLPIVSAVAVFVLGVLSIAGKLQPLMSDRAAIPSIHAGHVQR